MLASKYFGDTAAFVAQLPGFSNPRATLRSRIPQIRPYHRSLRKTRLHTFDPARLQPSDYLDVAGMTRKEILSSTEFPAPRAYIAFLTGYPSRMTTPNRYFAPFPPETQGFLYYHPPTDPPPLDEGHLRFRITESSDPATFSHGKDLLYPDGEPWSLACGRIAVSPTWGPLRHMLLNDRLVAVALLDEWSSRYTDRRGRRRDVLYDLEMPFVVDLAVAAHQLHIRAHAHSDETHHCRLIHPFVVREHRLARPLSLCTGRAICRFEDVGFRRKNGGPMLVLRLLKVLRPLELSEEALKRDIVFHRPKEGELFQDPFSDRPWARLIRRHDALHSLWKRWDERGSRTDLPQTS